MASTPETSLIEIKDNITSLYLAVMGIRKHLSRDIFDTCGGFMVFYGANTPWIHSVSWESVL